MTIPLSTNEVTIQITKHFPSMILEANDTSIIAKNEAFFDIAKYLKDTPGLDFDYLNYITAVDYYDYFELVYQLTSMEHNHDLVIKTRCYGRDNPTAPSVVSLWRSADFQEREIYDLMGIYFEGHPNMKRIALWEGFEGHPLRKDYL